MVKKTKKQKHNYPVLHLHPGTGEYSQLSSLCGWSCSHEGKPRPPKSAYTPHESGAQSGVSPTLRTNMHRENSKVPIFPSEYFAVGIVIHKYKHKMGHLHLYISKHIWLDKSRRVIMNQHWIVKWIHYHLLCNAICILKWVVLCFFRLQNKTEEVHEQEVL